MHHSQNALARFLLFLMFAMSACAPAIGGGDPPLPGESIDGGYADGGDATVDSSSDTSGEFEEPPGEEPPGEEPPGEEPPGEEPPGEEPPPIPEDDGPRAFPGARGHGTETTGGRGGEIFIVTNTNDSGPGSLREALEAEGRRIVVFRTGGVIELESTLRIREGEVTVMAQTAPGDGIAIRGGRFNVHASDVIIRGLRVRVGSVGGAVEESDALCICASESRPISNVVIDHSSFSWASDEVASTYQSISNVTFSWNIFAEGLRSPSLHPEGAHGFGFLISSSGDRSESLTLHHNLIANAPIRFPKMRNVSAEVINNVFFNWESQATEASTGTRVNLIANHYIPGANTEDPERGLRLRDVTSESAAYLEGNISPATPTGTEDQWALTWDEDREGRSQSDVPVVPSSGVPTTDATEATENVLGFAGASSRRDEVDARIAAEVRARSGSHPETEDDVGGYPSYDPGTPWPDADNDGIDDRWEEANGLDASNPSDSSELAPSGYMWVEVWANSFFE